MRHSKRIFSVVLSCLVVACAHSKTEPEANAAPPPAEVPAPAPPPTPPPAPEPALSAKPVAEPKVAPVAPAEQSWKVKKGKIADQPKPVQIGRFKNKKLPGYTTDVCFNYKDFGVVETSSTGEIGSAEIILRYASSEHKNACAPDFKGKYVNLKIIEGHFAGVAGDYIVVDGDDRTEGTIDFQMFRLTDGIQAYRGRRNPDEELTVLKKDGVTSVVYFAKVKVGCELAAEGEECWKKVLAANGVKKSLAMPECKAAFAAAKMQNFELALVTIRARVPDVSAPKIEFLGPKATCAPAPP